MQKLFTLIFLLFPFMLYAEEYRICEIREYGKVCYTSTEYPKVVESDLICIKFPDKYGNTLKAVTGKNIRIICGKYTIEEIK